MRDYRIRVTDMSTGQSLVQGYDRAAIARAMVWKINTEKGPEFEATYLSRKGSKIDQLAGPGGVSQ